MNHLLGENVGYQCLKTLSRKLHCGIIRLQFTEEIGLAGLRISNPNR